MIGVEVLYYGVGDGTWPMGSPGMIFKLDIDGDEKLAVVSDDSWQSFLDRAHRPGMYKRWFLRALQEEFDARLHPLGWDAPQFTADERWLKARVLPGPSDRSSLPTTTLPFVAHTSRPPDWCGGECSVARVRTRSAPHRA